MRNFEASPWLAQPLLVEVKSASVDKKRVSQFDMFVQLKRAAPTDAKDAAKPAAAKK
jgi:type IV pilus assembly protein PilN